MKKMTVHKRDEEKKAMCGVEIRPSRTPVAFSDDFVSCKKCLKAMSIKKEAEDKMFTKLYLSL